MYTVHCFPAYQEWFILFQKRTTLKAADNGTLGTVSTDHYVLADKKVTKEKRSEMSMRMQAVNIHAEALSNPLEALLIYPKLCEIRQAIRKKVLQNCSTHFAPILTSCEVAEQNHLETAP